MKKLGSIFLHFALIPFIISLLGLFVFIACGLPYVNIVIVPALAGIVYLIFKRKMDMPFAAKVNGIILLLLLVSFTVMMFISSGNVDGSLMMGYYHLTLPFVPLTFFYSFTGHRMLHNIIVFLTYAVSFAVTAYSAKFKIKKIIVPSVIAAACIITSSVLYFNRPAAKYSGHGFKYMHGYSSTDFSDYMVYSKNSKLVVPESGVSLVIENEKDMPVLDGAEACYPLYAAFAKAVYKDIDKIEKKWLKEETNQYCNGKIVTFTNSVVAFNRLLRNENDPGDRIDMFFGARPSASQLEYAEKTGIELNITSVGREAFVFFMEADNPVNDITSEQIKAIYHGDITNWSEIGGIDQEIIAFQRPHNSGSQTMMEYFMGDISLKEPKTFEKVDPMTGVIQEVAQYANDKGAIGYSFRYFLEELGQEKGVKMLSVDGVYPSLENIENGSYPLTVNVCLITRKDETNPYVQKMTDFILSEEGQDIIRKTGYAGVAKK